MNTEPRKVEEKLEAGARAGPMRRIMSRLCTPIFLEVGTEGSREEQSLELFKGSGFGFRVQGLGFRVQGLGFRV